MEFLERIRIENDYKLSERIIYLEAEGYANAMANLYGWTNIVVKIVEDNYIGLYTGWCGADGTLHAAKPRPVYFDIYGVKNNLEIYRIIKEYNRISKRYRNIKPEE